MHPQQRIRTGAALTVARIGIPGARPSSRAQVAADDSRLITIARREGKHRFITINHCNLRGRSVQSASHVSIM